MNQKQSRTQMIYKGLLYMLIIVCFHVNVSYQWNPPSFTSTWMPINFIDSSTSNLEVVHGLNELPMKVDVQIKVVTNNGAYNIFTGTGTMQKDDDEISDHPIGGVVYTYNDQKVILYPPTIFDIGVANTGSEADYIGPSAARGLYKSAQVRVRAWKASDFPEPLFTLSIPVNDTTSCFRQASYNSAVIPDLVVAQVLVPYVDLPDGVISEGQGNIFLSDTSEDDWAINGVVFGYDDKQVKLWVPIQRGDRGFSGAVFGYGDGFGYPYGSGGKSESSGTVYLRGYKLDKAFQTTFGHRTSLTDPKTISFGTSYSLDTALVMVQVREPSDSTYNPGMVFNGVGSAMAGSVIYSGVVYAYNESSALLYIPLSCNTNGYMIYLGDRWGNGQHPSSAKSADVIVTVFSDACPDPTVANTSHILTNGLLAGSTVQYTCDCGLHHTSGNLTRYCNSSFNWEGDIPTGTQQICSDPGNVYNATYTLTGHLLEDKATYTCVPPSTIKAGNAERICQADGTWSGFPLVCEVQFCPDPGNVYNATYTLSSQLVGDTATYTCVPPSTIKAGNIERICQADGTWSGIPVVCEVQFCPDPGRVYNATYTLSGQLLGNKATYTCVPPSIIKAGNVERTCEADGTWSGIPLVCEVQFCPDPGNVYNATYTLSGHMLGEKATYACIPPSTIKAGNAERICQADGTWSGIPLVCEVQFCPDPGNVHNATYTLFGQLPGDTATYTCVPPSTIKAGNDERICQADGTWSGIPLVCEVQFCADPGNVYNATYNVSGQLVGDKVTYACVPPSTIKAGNVERICQADGTWSGIPVVCYAASSTPNPVTYTSASLAESIEQTKKILTVEKKSTNAYKRRLTSASDSRRSAYYLGTAGVVVLCSVVLAVIAPDILTIFRHCRHFQRIYRNDY